MRSKHSKMEKPTSNERRVKSVRRSNAAVKGKCMMKSPRSIMEMGDMGIGKLSLGERRRKVDRKKLESSLQKFMEEVKKLGLEVEMVRVVEEGEGLGNEQ